MVSFICATGLKIVFRCTIALGNFKQNIEIPWKPYTPVAAGDDKRKSGAAGAAVSIALSREPDQRLMYVINQNDSEIEVLDRRSGKILSSFGRSGHFPGEFDQPLNIAVDSQANSTSPKTAVSASKNSNWSIPRLHGSYNLNRKIASLSCSI